MPETDHKGFDLQIRSLLADAETKPSRRVWKAVSRRLDADAAPAAASRSFGWLGWSGVALAAAAAIAAGIFLFDPIPTYHNIQKGETLAQMTETQAPEQIVSREQPEEQAGTVKVSPAHKAVNPSRVEIIPTTEQPALMAQAVEAPRTEESQAEEPRTDVSQTAREDRHVQEDPFARMAWEDAHRTPARPSQFYVAGSLGGNESGISSVSRTSRLSSSVDMPKSGITELGDSSYGIPFSAGLGVRFYIWPRLSVATGINYSLVSRSFEGKYNNVNGGIIEQNASGTFFHSMHYIGIPLNAYYDFITGGKIKFYGYAGAAAEYCVANKYNLFSENFTYTEPVKGIQWSAGAGVGVEFKVANFLGIYVDPGVRYYFDCNQPRNLRTEHPLLINFDAGLRFEF